MTVFRIRNKKTGEFLDCSSYGKYHRKNKVYYTLASARSAIRGNMRRRGIYSPTPEIIEQAWQNYEICEFELNLVKEHPCRAGKS